MEERRRDRATWPVRIVHQGDADDDDLSSTTTAEQRLAMMWSLAVEAWTLAGREIPSYSRQETPLRVVPREDADRSR